MEKLRNKPSPSAPIELNEIPPPSYDDVRRGLNPPSQGHPQKNRRNNDYEVVPVHLKREPTWLVCPYCFEQTITKTNEYFTEDYCFWSCILCIIGWPCCCCVVPFYLSKPNIVDHYCGHCQQFIGMPYELNPLLRDQVEEIRREVEGI